MGKLLPSGSSDPETGSDGKVQQKMIGRQKVIGYIGFTCKSDRVDPHAQKKMRADARLRQNGNREGEEENK